MSELFLDLNSATILDYRLGMVAPSEFNNESQYNKEDGYAINIYKECISSLFICLREGYENFSPFIGSVIAFGKEYYFDDHTTQEEILAAFGKPIESWNDGVEKGVDYSIGDHDVEVVWNVDGDQYLKYISIEN
jgi:hypothetical protein